MAGATIITPALILGTIRYGETSRIVRLATREAGVQSAIAKGALRPRSRFGASLQLLSEGMAHLIPSRSSELHTLAAFDVQLLHREVAGDLSRFAAANALAETAARFVPPMANPELYDELCHALAVLGQAPAEAIEVVGLRVLWQLITSLGLGPAVDACARDAAMLPEGPVAFSLREGGLLCAACARFGSTTTLGGEDRADLIALMDGSSELPLLSPIQAAAHRRLLLRWIREHLEEGPLPALEAWQHGAQGARVSGPASR
jgi:DNA repair protein RecO (recombination protein O)